MSIENLDFAAPFFKVKYVRDEPALSIDDKAIVLNLDAQPVKVEQQIIKHLQSVILGNTTARDLKNVVIVEGFEHPNNEALFQSVKDKWALAYDIRKEERLKNVHHYLSPKIKRGNLFLSMYHSASVPLNVGLHKDHPFCDVPGFKEVHTQIVGFGKMQQCRKKDLATLYWEENMAPGMTHSPMYDEQGNYPWHQYETITASIFMAVEMLPEGA